MKKSKIKNIIFINPKTQYGNLGDIVINKTLLDNLRKYGNLVINVNGVPEWFCQELEITDDEKVSKYKMSFKMTLLVFALKTLFQTNQKIYFVLNPGHHYSSSINIKNLGNLVKTISLFFTLKIIGVRICRFGASIGPFSTIDKIIEKFKSRAMYFYSVRDSKSTKYAEKLGINKVDYFPDLAWSMKLISTNYIFSNNVLDREYIIFSFREYPHELENIENFKKNLYIVLDSIVEEICINLDKKLFISYQVDSDYEFCRSISNRYKNKCNVTFIEHQLDTQSIYKLYSQASFIFSNRLHVLIFGMMYGSIPIAVIDEPRHDKITGIFSDANLMRLVVDISQNNHEIEVLKEITNNVNLIKQDIDLCINKYQKNSKSIFNCVMHE